jgi:hypothetical protein
VNLIIDMLLTGIMHDIRKLEKLASKLSVFRQQFQLWKTICIRLRDPKTNVVGALPVDMEDRFLVRMLAWDSELFVQAFDANIFLGFKPSPEQAATMERARKSLKTDPQFRLASQISPKNHPWKSKR